jgi:hypothetical protein
LAVSEANPAIMEMLYREPKETLFGKKNQRTCLFLDLQVFLKV